MTRALHAELTEWRVSLVLHEVLIVASPSGWAAISVHEKEQ